MAEKNCEVKISGVISSVEVITIKTFSKTVVRGIIGIGTKYEKPFEVEIGKKLAEMFNAQEGDEVTFGCFVNFREWNDKVFCSCQAYSCEVVKAKEKHKKNEPDTVETELVDELVPCDVPF